MLVRTELLIEFVWKKRQEYQTFSNRSVKTIVWLGVADYLPSRSAKPVGPAALSSKSFLFGADPRFLSPDNHGMPGALVNE